MFTKKYIFITMIICITHAISAELIDCSARSVCACTTQPEATLETVFPAHTIIGSSEDLVNLEALFIAPLWKEFCQKLSREEQITLKAMIRDTNKEFRALSDNLDYIIKNHKKVVQKYKQYMQLPICCFSINFKLESQEEVVPMRKKSIDSEEINSELKQKFIEHLKPEEKNEFELVQSEMQELSKKASVEITAIFQAQPALKAKLTQYCESTKQTLALSMQCNQLELSQITTIA
jgi:hypothetical protein